MQLHEVPKKFLNKDFKKKDHLQNSKQNYLFSNLIEMQRTHIFIHLFRV